MSLEQKRLLDQVEQAVFVLEPDAEGIPRYTAFNRYALGHIQRREAEVLGLTIRDLFPGRYGETIYGHHLRVLREGRPFTYQAHLPLHGAEHRIEVTLRPCLDDSGRVTHIVGTTKDISGLGHLQNLQLGAEMFHAEIEDFVSLAAHDLRTPMRHVRTIAEMLREDFEDMGDGKLELIDMLEQIGTRATQLISDILAHAQATTTQSDVRAFSFRDLVNEVLALLDPMGRCVCNISGDQVVGDRAATLIVLRNLIDNALKYGRRADDGPLHVDISLSAEPDDFYAVEVKDNGPGLRDPAALLLNTGTLRTDGGFGLLGVHRLVRARGGTIDARNNEDQPGAVIRFTLPGHLPSAAA
jgi:signal transduction histidine kinase